MAKLRATSVQDSLTVSSLSNDSKIKISNDNLSLSNGSEQGYTSVNLENDNGNLKINFVRYSGAIPSINAENCNVNVGKTLSAKSISLPSGEITIDDALDGNDNLIFSGININKKLPNSIAETVQSGDYITLGKNSTSTVSLADDIDINKGVDNSVFSNIEDITYETSGSYIVITRQ